MRKRKKQVIGLLLAVIIGGGTAQKPADVCYAMDVSELTAKTWLWQGYRLSDSWEYTFYPDGTSMPVSVIGVMSTAGTYTFDGINLCLYNSEGIRYDWLKYDETENIFTSILRQVYTGDDYVDPSGVYHPKPVRQGTLVGDGVYADTDETDTPYLLMGSGSRECTVHELEGMSDWELTLARNEIYARHGRRFRDEQIQAYFDSCTWYEGTISPEDFEGHEMEYLSSVELANVNLIYEYQGEPTL